MSGAPEPVRAGERVVLLDILRGFALLGILLVNFEGHAGTLVPTLDRAVDTGLDLLVSDSLYPLFSFLFGLGLALQLARAGGAGVAHLYLRRLLALFLIGTLHALLFWDGDILVNYAFLGLLLLPLHRLPARGLLAAALLLLAFQLVQPRVQAAVDGWHSTPEREQVRELAEGVREEDTRIAGNLRSDESWRNALEFRWVWYSRKVYGFRHPLRALGDDILLLFVLGMLIGRRRLLERKVPPRRGLRLAAALGAIAAIAGNLRLSALPDASREAELLLGMAANWGVTVFYIAGITLAVARGGRTAARWSLLAPVGRMGLTNYLLQSAVMTTLFFPSVLGLPDLGATLRLLVNVGFFFLVQVPLSRWWLGRFHHGPAEWVWRSLTYGRAQPLRLRRTAPQPAPLLEGSPP